MATELHADCDNCFALCCVVTGFAKSNDFAFSRDVGVACPNLNDDYRCNIHASLRPKGMAGCTKFDCFGAGQKVSRVTFGGRSWRESPVVGTQMSLVFSVMRPLHELLWYLTSALTFAEGPIAQELADEIKRIELLSEGDVRSMFKVGLAKEQATVAELLQRASASIREGYEDRVDYRNATLDAVDLRDVKLAGADLSGATFVFANLQDVDFARADVLHAKFPGAEVSGADLSNALFITQYQVNSADGDARTLLPERIYRPSHWVDR